MHTLPQRRVPGLAYEHRPVVIGGDVDLEEGGGHVAAVGAGLDALGRAGEDAATSSEREMILSITLG